MYRFSAQIASNLECPAATRRATCCLVFSPALRRPIAMIWRALLASRSLPRFSRCLIVLPDDAVTGLMPQRAAKLPWPSVPYRNLQSLTDIARLDHGHMHGQDSHVTNSVRPLLGHKQTRRQSLTARRSRPADRSRERHAGRSEFGSSHIRTPCVASLPSDQTVFETNRAGTGYHLLTIGVEYIRLSLASQRLLDRCDAAVRFHRDRQPPRQDLPAEPVHDGAEIFKAAFDFPRTGIRDAVRRSGV